MKIQKILNQIESDDDSSNDETESDIDKEE